MSVPIHQYLQYLFESSFPERELPQSLLVTSHSGTRAGWHQTNEFKSIGRFELVLVLVVETNLKNFKLELQLYNPYIYHSQRFKMDVRDVGQHS